MKAHLLSSSDPLHEGKPLTALCGRMIFCSKFVFSYEGEIGLFRDFLNGMTQCRACVIKAEEQIVDGGEQGRSYWYGIVEAQEADRG